MENGLPVNETRKDAELVADAGDPRRWLILLVMTGSLAMGGQGLGTAGCTPLAAEKMAREAGFTRFRVQETGLHGQKHRCYIVQP